MAQTTRLASFGPVFAVPVQSVVYLVTSTCIYNKCIVSTKEKRKKKRKNSPMAQTMPDASFGPDFAVPAQSVAYLVTSTCIYNKCIVSTKKKRKKKKQTHLWPKRCAWRRLGPFLLSPTSLPP